MFFTKTALVIIGFCSATAFSKDVFTITSNLKPGQSIPADYYGNSFGCTAKGESPRLEWKNIPPGTKSFAVTFYDKDAPTGSGFWHYVLVDIPPTVTSIDVGDLTKGKIPAGALETNTDAGKPGYFGPCPPVGRKHTYTFTVHALKVDKLGVPASSPAAFVGFNIWSNLISKASFSVTAGPRR
jgi:Raf kinase inhibitor-like YbhB/YbcL family protein